MTPSRLHLLPISAPACRLLVAVALAMAGLGGALAQEPSRLSEVYGDWTVNCVAGENDARTCFMVQTLTDENRRRVLQAEIRLIGSTTHFALLAPLGVLLPAGVSTNIDEGEAATMAFHTCLAAGCIVRSELSAEQVAELRRGKEMTVRLKAADTGAEVTLRLSLSGISAALSRLAKLSG